ncbi:hypothetical protein [Maribacter hydrothermalis]|uniref:Doxx family protein n=1 Tax=Maribacter hydrothermalis TaxID=1836467 RepID=A0A1B7ZBG0_9FLAO|nr:hypothetical protein [Maribacter hydrothermalis]APQ16474.1 hypothetical protein BTR34_03605 [Maribacter hydrothermalis]OBR40038.1 hypothetical protein A9200_17205 [Maribacter hydrothermalis]
MQNEVFKNFILSRSIGIVYLLFGVVKFVPHWSPAEQLAGETITILTMGLIPTQLCLLLLALFETVIGICLLFNLQKTIILNLAIFHVLFTFSPLFILSNQIFGNEEAAFTLTGQYIFKNIILLSVLVSLRLEAPVTSPTHTVLKTIRKKITI